MNRRKQIRLGRDAAQLAWAVPQVVAHRTARLVAASGAAPSARDQQEFFRMGAEKVAAFGESLAAMGLQTLLAQQQFALWWWGAWWQTALHGFAAAEMQRMHSAAQRRLLDATLDVASRGIAPVHRRAVANARRLSAPPER